MFEQQIRFQTPPTSVWLADALAPLNVKEALSEAPQQDRPVDENNQPPITQLLQRMADVLEAIDARRATALEEMQHVAIELALAIASRLVYEKIEAGEFAVEKLVETAVDRLGMREPVTVRLHPADVQLLESRLENQSDHWSHEDLRIVADASLDRGDCRADTENVGILAKLDLQLADMRQYLLQNLEDAQIERRTTKGGAAGIRRFPDRRETA